MTHAAVHDIDQGILGRRRVAGSCRCLFKAELQFGRSQAERVVAGATNCLQFRTSRAKRTMVVAVAAINPIVVIVNGVVGRRSRNFVWSCKICGTCARTGIFVNRYPVAGAHG